MKAQQTKYKQAQCVPCLVPGQNLFLTNIFCFNGYFSYVHHPPVAHLAWATEKHPFLLNNEALVI